ncbi:MAG TPA: DUF2911 domain-containing protein [Flavisolibacter sp.]|nr:DUF2911 domain-containing protein [Flavisolibacter sp.]
MKKIFTLTLLAASLFTTQVLQAQGDKSARPSPPATVSQKISSGATVTIHYSQPSVKGRVIGKDLEPMDGKVWRMGANEATVFEVDKDVNINGKALPAGKYAIFGIKNGNDFTLIFNKEWKVWGTQYEKNKDKDALQVKLTSMASEGNQEKLTYTIDQEGKVSLLWGNMIVDFLVH